MQRRRCDSKKIRVVYRSTAGVSFCLTTQVDYSGCDPNHLLDNQSVGGRNYIYENGVSPKVPTTKCFLQVSSNEMCARLRPNMVVRYAHHNNDEGLNVSVRRGKMSCYTCTTRRRIFRAATIIEKMTVHLWWKTDNY